MYCLLLISCELLGGRFLASQVLCLDSRQSRSTLIQGQPLCAVWIADSTPALPPAHFDCNICGRYCPGSNWSDCAWLVNCCHARAQDRHCCILQEILKAVRHCVQFIDSNNSLQYRTFKINVCGEGGELETLVLRAPAYAAPIEM